MKIFVRVQPRSSKEEVVKLKENEYKIYMHEPALEGKANKRLIEILAEYFKTKKSSISIISGPRSKKKILNINL